jgi:hypothetical protein
MFITGLEGITHWAASGTIVKRWDRGKSTEGLIGHIDD